MAHITYKIFGFDFKFVLIFLGYVCHINFNDCKYLPQMHLFSFNNKKQWLIFIERIHRVHNIGKSFHDRGTEGNFEVMFEKKIDGIFYMQFDILH